MKKSSAIFILIFLVFFVFIFENLRGLMSRLEKAEVDSLKTVMKTEAEFVVLKYGGDIDLIKKSKRFDRVFLSSGKKANGMGEDETGVLYYFFTLNDFHGNLIRFEKKLMSPVSKALHKIKGIISALTLLLGILIVIIGIYLILISRKKKDEKPEVTVPLLQDYLMKLEDSKTILKETVEKQKVDVVRSDEINRTIINNINAAIIFVNSKGRVDIFNTYAEKLFEKNFVNAKNVRAISVLSKFPEISSLIEKTGTKPLFSELISKEKVFLVEVTPISSGGKIVIIRDISERKLREALKNKRKNFETLGEMTLFLTHEIRNSLGVIYGYTKTFKGDKLKTEKINREIEFLSGMMESFLNFSKPVSVKNPVRIDIPELLEKIAADYSMRIDIKGKEQGVFDSDKDLIFSVFSNLVKNAGESGADQLAVEIENRDSGKLTILFKDNGRGIKRDVRDKIWLPFFTSRDKGTGMGLAIVKKIIYSLNGEITLSETGKNGTTFLISFLTEE